MRPRHEHSSERKADCLEADKPLEVLSSSKRATRHRLRGSSCETTDTEKPGTDVDPEGRCHHASLGKTDRASNGRCRVRGLKKYSRNRSPQREYSIPVHQQRAHHRRANGTTNS